jgi:hypothetical protein
MISLNHAGMPPIELTLTKAISGEPQILQLKNIDNQEFTLVQTSVKRQKTIQTNIQDKKSSFLCKHTRIFKGVLMTFIGTFALSMIIYDDQTCKPCQNNHAYVSLLSIITGNIMRYISLPTI